MSNRDCWALQQSRFLGRVEAPEKLIWTSGGRVAPYLRGPRRATEAELTRLNNSTANPAVADSAVARALALAGDAILGEAVRRIREHFSPAQVVLFGSRARRG